MNITLKRSIWAAAIVSTSFLQTAHAGGLKPYCKDAEIRVAKEYSVEKAKHELKERARIARLSATRSDADKVLANLKKVEDFFVSNKDAKAALAAYQRNEIDDRVMYAFVEGKLLHSLRQGFEHKAFSGNQYIGGADQNIDLRLGVIKISLQAYEKNSKEKIDAEIKMLRSYLASTSNRSSQAVQDYCDEYGHGCYGKLELQRSEMQHEIAQLEKDRESNYSKAEAHVVTFNMHTGKIEKVIRACMDDKQLCEAKQRFASYDDYLKEKLGAGCFFGDDVVSESAEKSVESKKASSTTQPVAPTDYSRPIL